MTGQKQESSRVLALFVIMEVLEQGKKLNEALTLKQEVYQYLPKKERAYLNRLSRGCVERFLQLDYIINRYSSRRTEKMKPVIRNILRMGIYEILFMEKVPDRAACNEAVSLAKKKGFSGLSGFVNGVLRTAARNKDEILNSITNARCEDEKNSSVGDACREDGIIEKEDFLIKGFSQYMEYKYSIPGWLSEYWEKHYGKEITEKMCEDFLKENETTLRIDTDKISVEELKEKIKKEGINVREGDYCPYALKVSEYDHPGAIPGFSEGWFQIQDESSMLAVLISGAGALSSGDGKTGNTVKVLDVCSAPGGKSIFYAQLLKGKGIVEARDISPGKLRLIEENIERLGIDNINVKLQDALEIDEELSGLLEEDKFDIVAADLPCSGLGVIGKKCDIKYRISPGDLKELSELQRKILSRCCGYVKPGGVLIYSTCTVNPGENEENALWFLREHEEFEPYGIGEYIPRSLRGRITDGKKKTKEGNMLQLFPGIHKTDGFFMAGFKRKGNNI